MIRSDIPRRDHNDRPSPPRGDSWGSPWGGEIVAGSSWVKVASVGFTEGLRERQERR